MSFSRKIEAGNFVSNRGLHVKAQFDCEAVESRFLDEFEAAINERNLYRPKEPFDKAEWSDIKTASYDQPILVHDGTNTYWCQYDIASSSWPRGFNKMTHWKRWPYAPLSTTEGYGRETAKHVILWHTERTKTKDEARDIPDHEENVSSKEDGLMRLLNETGDNSSVIKSNKGQKKLTLPGDETVIQTHLFNLRQADKIVATLVSRTPEPDNETSPNELQGGRKTNVNPKTTTKRPTA